MLQEENHLDLDSHREGQLEKRKHTVPGNSDKEARDNSAGCVFPPANSAFAT